MGCFSIGRRFSGGAVLSAAVVVASQGLADDTALSDDAYLAIVNTLASEMALDDLAGQTYFPITAAAQHVLESDLVQKAPDCEGVLQMAENAAEMPVCPTATLVLSEAVTGS